ncbi:MAG: histidinol-phosphate transaminase [Oscillospiraceae bacterium]|nr:histidinol-phosphate transaminase [Oscillospiraceae bacterium]
MSRFFSRNFAALEAYTPGEQPRDMQYVKLNTNESPFPPTERVSEAALREARRLNLYCDPACTDLRQAAAALYGVSPQNLLPVNGSDEILYFSFLAFCDDAHPAAFPETSYGFYPVYARVNRIPAHTIPLKDDFSIDYRDYCGLGETVVLANPNAPTGMLLPVWQLEEIVRTNPDNVVLIDEAYIDFGGESCVPLTKQYENLLVTQTFSKSRSMAGARLGFGIGSEALIGDLNTIKYSVNPYNVNRMTQAAGVAACEDNEIYMAQCREIMATREDTVKALERRGFRVLPSAANFVFAGTARLPGGDLYRALRRHGVLVRHFDKKLLENYLRITIGTREQMERLLREIDTILETEGTV